MNPFYYKNLDRQVARDLAAWQPHPEPETKIETFRSMDRERGLIPEVYWSLFEEARMLTPVFVSAIQTAYASDNCCKNQTVVNHDGFTICWDCGKQVSNLHTYMFYHPYKSEGGQPRNSGVQFAPKKRYYNTKNHFKTHINRYFGNIPGSLPESLIAELRTVVDLEDQNAYIVVRRHLRNSKQPQLYPSIFKILQALGGHQPPAQGNVIQRLTQEINNLQSFFYDNRARFGHHNMRCVGYMLEQCMHLIGYTPFYYLPKLKDETRLIKAKEFFSIYLSEVVTRRDQ